MQSYETWMKAPKTLSQEMPDGTRIEYWKVGMVRTIEDKDAKRKLAKHLGKVAEILRANEVGDYPVVIDLSMRANTARLSTQTLDGPSMTVDVKLDL